MLGSGQPEVPDRLNLRRNGPCYVILEGVPPHLGERDLAELAGNPEGVEQITIYENISAGQQYFAVFTFGTREDAVNGHHTLHQRLMSTRLDDPRTARYCFPFRLKVVARAGVMLPEDRQRCLDALNEANS